jgi:hypothetical protein
MITSSLKWTVDKELQNSLSAAPGLLKRAETKLLKHIITSNEI